MDFLRYVGVNNYMLEKNFVKLMVCFLNFVNNRSCVVFYSFSDCFQFEIMFDGYEDCVVFDFVVNNVLYFLGFCCIDRVFEFVV